MAFEPDYFAWAYSNKKETIFFKPNPPKVFPYPLYAIHEIEDSDRFYSRGELRQAEHHASFFYTLRGSGICWRGSDVQHVGPGEGFLNIINEMNTGYAYPSDSTENWEFVVLSWAGGNSIDTTRYIMDTYGIKYSIPQSATLIKTLLQMPFSGKEVQFPDYPISQGMTLVNLVISTIVDLFEDQNNSKHPPVIKDVLQIIHTSKSRCPTVSELADQVNLSREYLSRIFHQNMGVSLSQYIMKSQIRIAQDLLANENIPIYDISNQLGYANPAAFSVAFKRATTLSPSQYRLMSYSRVTSGEIRDTDEQLCSRNK